MSSGKRKDKTAHVMLAADNYVHDTKLDFDLWTILCLVCDTNITPDGRYRIGTVQSHLHSHGLQVRGTASTPDSPFVEREYRGKDDWCHTVQVVYAMGFGHQQPVYIVTRVFGMGLTRWRVRRREKAQDGRRVAYRYIPTASGENAAHRPAQRVLGHMK